MHTLCIFIQYIYSLDHAFAFKEPTYEIKQLRATNSNVN